MKTLAPMLTTLLLFTAVLAQTPTPTGTAPAPTPAETKPDQGKEGGTVAPSGTINDPTKVSPRLKEAMTPTRPTGTAAPLPKLPSVQLRGRVIAKNQPGMAMLEVEGKMYMVVKGSNVPGPAGSILRITNLDSHEIRIEVTPINEVIILR